MTALARLTEAASITAGPVLIASGSMTVSPLSGAQETEVLAFLAARPVQTVYMAGLIRDNGLINPLNRGTFYGCRDLEGRLEGVALIGHVTVVETRSEAALQALACRTQECSSAHVIMGDQEKVERFWMYWAPIGQTPRRVCRELLLEKRWPVEVHEEVPGLRLGTCDDLRLTVPVHAEMALEESGVNPLEVDPEGFRLRCMRRMEQGRAWVWIEDGRLIFKADVISDTPEVVYLEGIYVNPEERGKGHGLRCMSQLGRKLLERTDSISLLVNKMNQPAQNLYRRAGFKLRGFYDTLYLNKALN